MIRDRLLFSEPFREALSGDRLSVVDVGARGSLEEPWGSLPDGLLRVVGFEPDEEECRRLNAAAGEGETYIPAALWSQQGEVDVHLAEIPECSSVHPPNSELLDRYRAEHRRPRHTRSVTRYPAMTLDAALADAGLGCDFLKIDTQGAEYEILSGAAHTLESEAFGVLVETWTAEVHRGQRLTGEVLTLMADRGFALFDVSTAAAWLRQSGEGLDLDGKRQVIGLDLLFFRDPPRWPEPQPHTRLVKAAAIADVYGFPDFALELLGSATAGAPDPHLIEVMREHVLRTSKSTPGQRRGLLRRRAPAARPEYASLHY